MPRPRSVPALAFREEIHGQTPFRGRLRRLRRRAGDAFGSCAGGLSLARRHLHQPLSARRRRRRGGAAARRGAGADPQAAGGDRDQGRRRRPGRRPVRGRRQARRLHAAHAHRVDLGLRRGRQAVRPAREVHARRFHPDRPLHRRPDGAGRQRPAAAQDPEGVRRRRQEAAQRADLQLIGPLRRPAPADRAVHERRRHPDEAPADQRRRPGPDGGARQQLARCWCPRSRRRARR